ncbi:MAG: hypothetical protein Alpg2KO_08690 [Alphaproteobacteria bacterium]
MKLILARHGNTFGPGDTPVWVGGRNDMALVEKGLEQARAAADALTHILPADTRICAAPLKRTHVFAQTIAADRFAVTVDERLREVHYGTWAMRSNDEIREEYGQAPLDEWSKFGRYPDGAGFEPPIDTIRGGLHDLAGELQASGASTALCVSSNGILRHFLSLIPGAYEDFEARHAFKVLTGNLCALDLAAQKVLFWNLTPQEADESLTSLFAD